LIEDGPGFNSAGSPAPAERLVVASGLPAAAPAPGSFNGLGATSFVVGRWLADARDEEPGSSAASFLNALSDEVRALPTSRARKPNGSTGRVGNTAGRDGIAFSCEAS
jgi:hypothetical protein